MPGSSAIVPGGAALFQRVYTRLGCEGRPPRFRVEFYPYSSLVLTIRRREEMGWVRLSGLLRRARLNRPGVAAAADVVAVDSGCSLVSHSREFREEEKRFAEFERARRVLDRLAR